MKTSELIGNALDYAVAIAEGTPKEELKLPRHKMDSLFRYTRGEDGNLDGYYVTGPDLIFSRKWEAGGPIIEREKITVMPQQWHGWVAFNHAVSELPKHQGWGETPLIAAMRCYVASKLGDEVEIPRGLA